MPTVFYNLVTSVGLLVMIAGLVVMMSNYEKRGGRGLGLLFTGAIVSVVGLAFFPATASAQEPPPLPDEPLTVFSAACQMVEGDSLVIRWGYESNGAYRWIGQGYDFTTSPGSYPGAFEYVTAFENPQLEPLGLGRVSYQDDAPYDLVTGGLVESVWVDLMPDNLAVCGSEPTPTAEPTAMVEPTPDLCPAWAIDGATGAVYCLYSLPFSWEYQ